MIHAYSELYLDDAKENLAELFDYAINDCEMDMDLFPKLFIASGYALHFERGNPAIIVGMSGVELARKVLEYTYPDKKLVNKTFRSERDDVYWAGWALAQYQWESARTFRDIFERISFTEIVDMYKIYHEMDISQFIEEMDRRYMSIHRETNLKRIRENRGVSQRELAELSGVNLRSIQMYEQRENDIDKAQGLTLYRLSLVLGCMIEDLLEKNDL